MADAMRDWLAERFPSDKSESPMEALFHGAYMMARPHLMLPPEPIVRFQQQVKLGQYRADFLFTVKPEAGGQKELVVEIDGHDFHERTKQQAARDKARDRWMTGAGYVVIRFTGSELWANPFAVVTEVANRIHQLRYGMSRREAAARAGLDAIRRMLED